MHSAHNMCLLLIITDSAKILHAYDELFFLGKCGVKRSRLGSLQFLTYNRQHAKKVVSNSPRLVDFAIGLVNSVFILRNSNNRRTVKSILLVKELLGLVEMMTGLVNASFSLPKRQAVKMIFFAP